MSDLVRQPQGRVAARIAEAGESGNDMLIAAQALSLNLTVVTDNGREFSRVPGLIVENWLR